MSARIEVGAWVRAHRRALFAAWAVIGALAAALLVLFAPDVYYLRGIAPWPRRWMVAFFVSLWCWVGLRFIARWVWAWVVMALAPLCLFLPLRFYLNAWWLMPLLAMVVALSLSTLVVVALKHRRHRDEVPIAVAPRARDG